MSQQAISAPELAIDTILYDMWGYEQTNVDFYKVVGRRGKTVVDIQKVAQNRESTEWMQGTCTPIPDRTISATITKRVNRQGCLNSPLGGSLAIWDGKPMHYTSYY